LPAAERASKRRLKKISPLLLGEGSGVDC